MIVRPQNWNVFQTMVSTTFWLAYADAPVVNPMIAKTIPSRTRFYTEGWIGRFPKAREWIGSRAVHTPAPQTYQVEMQLYEDTIGIDAYELKDDEYGVFNNLIPNLAINAKQDHDWKLRDLIEGLGNQAGSRQLGTDQLTHWNSAHPVDFYDPTAGTYTNDYGPTGTVINGITVGGALAPNAYATVKQDMQNRKSETGEPMGIKADMLVVATQNEYTANAILQAQFLGLATIGNIGAGNSQTAGTPAPLNTPLVGSSNNVLKASVEQLTWEALYQFPAAWYLLKTRGPVKPFQIAMNEAYSLQSRTNTQDPIVWDTHSFLYGIVGRFAPTWAPPFLSSRSGV
jgi:phage major head subunit gpT-like protein